jgi:MerR HTH family regulatory protein
VENITGHNRGAQTQSRAARESSEPVAFVSPILNGVERPITTAELAEHLRVTTRTIASYREQRLIPFWRINPRRILYRLSDVERCLSLKS